MQTRLQRIASVKNDVSYLDPGHVFLASNGSLILPDLMPAAPRVVHPSAAGEALMDVERAQFVRHLLNTLLRSGSAAEAPTSAASTPMPPASSLAAPAGAAGVPYPAAAAASAPQEVAQQAAASHSSNNTGMQPVAADSVRPAQPAPRQSGPATDNYTAAQSASPSTVPPARAATAQQLPPAPAAITSSAASALGALRNGVGSLLLVGLSCAALVAHT